MSALILSGRACADVLLETLKPRIAKLDPRLVIVQVGDNPASAKYIEQKLKACTAVGMRAELRHLEASTTLDSLLSVIAELNEDNDVSGFIVQLPLPSHLNESVPQVIKAIDPKKDVDGFGAYNLGKVLLSKDFEHLPPATPAGIIELLNFYKINPAGKHVVIVGRSNIVGKPLAMMLLNRDATVTVCHSKTAHMEAITSQADILICAAGKAGLITEKHVKKGAVVIDVGTSPTDDGLKGDVDVASVSPIASALSPVPGGVGPMTVASLIKNCVIAKERQMAT